jgi:ADP-dependent NAD(P)H-hydrate dehydratase / NAD(P)H-hydrate epimerase
VQHNRLAAAQKLADKFGCVVVLKGSGSVIAAPGCIPTINPTGNARLATAGTGDVLAGMVGAELAGETHGRIAKNQAHALSDTDFEGQSKGSVAARLDVTFKAACQAVYWHGLCASKCPAGQTMVASDLLRLL